MKSRPVYVDAEVFARLRYFAEPGETPNTVIRRVLGLAEKPQGRRSSVLRPFEEEKS